MLSAHHDLRQLAEILSSVNGRHVNRRSLYLYNNIFKYTTNMITLFVLGTNSCRALILSAILSLLSCIETTWFKILLNKQAPNRNENSKKTFI
jgi:hypothetical protein